MGGEGFLLRSSYPLHRPCDGEGRFARRRKPGGALAPLVHSTRNRVQHAIQLFIDLPIPEPQHAPALRFQLSRPPYIARKPSSFAVLKPIQLDHQLGCRAREVRHERPNRMLPPKLRIFKSLGAQSLPELRFDIRLIAPQPARTACRASRRHRRSHLSRHATRATLSPYGRRGPPLTLSIALRDGEGRFARRRKPGGATGARRSL